MADFFPAQLLNIVFTLNMFLVVLVVIFERRKPSSTMAWLLILFFMPLAGFFLYLFLGQDLRRQRLFHLKANEEHLFFQELIHQEQNFVKKARLSAEPIILWQSNLVRMNFRSGSLLFWNNDVKLFHDGKSLFKDILHQIKQAEHFIYLQSYIFADDNLGNEVMDLLISKAQEGVDVRVLYDGMGCMKVPNIFFQRLEAAGGKTAEFFPPFLPYINLRINFRNHRKILIIDGIYGYIGGFNIGDEYREVTPQYGFWRDTHIKLQGEAIHQLELRFLMDWRYASKEDEITLSSKSWYICKNNKACGNIPVQIISSGPDSVFKSIHGAYLKLISTARESIYIQTPYFVPDESIFKALQNAGLSGVDVRIMIPRRPDHPFVLPCAFSYMGELLPANVHFYLYDKGFLHSKIVIVDGQVASVGSANMDIRSFELNFESNAIIYSEKIALELQKAFCHDIKDCHHLTIEE